MKAYKDFRRELVLSLEDKDISVANAAVLTGKLTQYANGVVYTEDGKTEIIHSKKLDALEDTSKSTDHSLSTQAYLLSHHEEYQDMP